MVEQRPQRTYWHLEGRGRVPSDYEVVTTGLLYYPTRGLAVRTPVAEWMTRHQRADRLRCSDWDRFEDPRATTYATYTELQQRRTLFVEGVLRTTASSGRDARMPASWLGCVQQVLAPARYPAHALQMVSAYVGSMAPSGRVAVAFAFQSADALRTVQALAYRLAMLRVEHEELTRDARAHWQDAAGWQPWRRLMERLLVSYDFDEALVALNLVVKPAFDAVFLTQISQAAQAPDPATHQVLVSLLEDSAWQSDFTGALFHMLAASEHDNMQRTMELARPWLRPTFEAVNASAEELSAWLGKPQAVVEQVRAALNAHWARAGLSASEMMAEASA